MAIFDDIHSELKNISAKLSQNPNSGNILNQLKGKANQSDTQDTASLERAFTNALNRVPVLNQIANSLRGFSQIVRDFVASTGAGYVGGKLGSLSKITSPIGFGYQAGRDLWNDKSISGRFKNFGFAHSMFWSEFGSRAKKGGLNLLGSGMVGLGDFLYGKQKNNNFIKRAGYDLSIGGGALLDKAKAIDTGGMGKSFPLSLLAGAASSTTAGIAGPLVAGTLGFGVALALAVPAVLKFTKSLIESQRQYAALSPTLSLSFALSDIRNLLRDLHWANATGTTTANMAAAWDDAMQKLLPIMEDLYNNFGKLAVGAVELIVAWTRLYNYLEDKLDRLIPDEEGHKVVTQMQAIKNSHQIVFGTTKALKNLKDFEFNSVPAKDLPKEVKIPDFIKKQLEGIRKALEELNKTMGADISLTDAPMFMAGAATWNYEGKDRAYHTQKEIWDAHQKIKGGA